MRARRTILSATVVLGLGVLSVFGCSDSTAPISRLTFCSPPLWVAVKLDGESTWKSQEVTGNAVTFEATPTLSIAYSFSVGSVYIWSLSADEFREIRVAPVGSAGRGGCSPDYTKLKTLAGSATGIAPGRQYDVASTATFANTSGATFTLGAPDGPVDLVARMFHFIPEIAVEKVIVRRDVNLPNGASIPVFDFASPEARPLDSASLVVTYPDGSALTSFSGSFVTSLRTRSPSGLLRLSSNRPLPFLHSVPQALLRPDDYHDLRASACLPDCGQLSFYYRSARATSLAMGPMAGSATASVVATDPCVRLHFEIPAQSEYPSFVQIVLSWGSSSSNRSVVMGVTKAYLGATPSTWTYDVPELRRGDGSCLLEPAAKTARVFTTVGEGRLALLADLVPGRDGELLRAASRTSGVQ